LERLLKDMFGAAVAAARPSVFMPRAISALDLTEPIHVIGAGKASTGMAEVVEALLDVRSGVVVTRYGQASTCRLRRVSVLEAAHPVPDDASARAAVEILSAARGCPRETTMLCLLSGGGSSLMSLPVSGVTRLEKANLIRSMLEAGVPIDDMNCVRRHISAVKGGRLAVASTARLVTLALSDVVGDDPSTIASGPTSPDETTLADALDVLERFRVKAAPSILAALRDPANETPSSSDPAFERCRFRIVACGEDALAAAEAVARSERWDVINLGAGITGDSRAAASMMAGRVRELRAAGRRCVLLSGGETTTVVRGPGCGGRNTEFLLALALELKGQKGIWALAADTDGIDGVGGHAGAWFGPSVLAGLEELSQMAITHLDDSNSAGFFEMAGGLIETGPTGTNVNDFRAILID